MTPEVKAFFDEATFTVSYVVTDPGTKNCAIIDSVYPISGWCSLLRWIPVERLCVRPLLSTMRNHEISALAQRLEVKPDYNCLIAA